MIAEPKHMPSTWSLRALLASWVELAPADDREIASLAIDSRQVEPGALFLACASHGAAEHIAEAAGRGAAAVLTRGVRPGGQATLGIPVVAVDDPVALAGHVADRFYGHPSHHMSVIGVTGTNGKTSVSHYIARALVAWQPHARPVTAPCGLLGTLGYGLYGNLAAGTLTTPDALRVHQVLASCRAKGARYAVMEVSSHGLEQERLAGVEFTTAVFTNLTRDHLDYHGDMATYAAAKQRLFEHPALQYAVINALDPFGGVLVDALCSRTEALTYALHETPPAPGQMPAAMVLGWVEARERDALVIGVNTPWGSGRIDAPLLGRFNAENLLAALATLLLSGVPIERATAMLCETKALPGRMECISIDGSPMVVVDYAHTPDALGRALQELRAHCTGTLWCVFGCGGERDAGKRPQMGAIAAEHADRVVLTDDNPRCEDGQRIVEDVLTGVQDKTGFEVERNREQAIRLAVRAAGREDVILVAGKGHEPYQEIAGERHRFSDVETVRRLLGEVSR